MLTIRWGLLHSPDSCMWPQCKNLCYSGESEPFEKLFGFEVRGLVFGIPSILKKIRILSVRFGFYPILVISGILRKKTLIFQEKGFLDTKGSVLLSKKCSDSRVRFSITSGSYLVLSNFRYKINNCLIFLIESLQSDYNYLTLVCPLIRLFVSSAPKRQIKISKNWLICL